MRLSMRCAGTLLGALVGLLAFGLLVPAAALAHPLGNFTINHYAGIRVQPDRIVLDVVIDQAEIPTFQEKLRIDADGDGLVSDAEADGERVAACPVLARSLQLSVADRALPLVSVEAGLSFLPGAGGLQTIRLVCAYTATLPEPLRAGTRIAFSDRAYSERLGWREIVVTGSNVSVATGLPSASVSDRLTRYPSDTLAQPLSVRSAAFTASPGGPSLGPITLPDASPLAGAVPLDTQALVDSGILGRATAIAPSSGTVPGGVGGEISGLLEARDLTPLMILVSFATAVGLGAGHALTPGHGKTLMGAYLVGTRGTPLHAVALGLSVTISHTLGILALAAIVIGLRGIATPEAFSRTAPILSGVLVLGIGAWLLIGQLRPGRALSRAADANAHDVEQAHNSDHGHEAGQVHAHGHGAEHVHGGIHHSHLPTTATTSSPIGWRSLFVSDLPAESSHRRTR